MKMKAAVYTEYGSPEVLKIKEVNVQLPKAKELRIRVHASAVNSGDWRLRKADPYAVRFFMGFRRPKKQVLGSVYSGVVESIGEGTTRFKVGEQVFGHTDMNFGAYAEYLCVNEASTITCKPDSISHNEAASIPFGAVTALHFIKKAQIKSGQSVVIVGASGAVGSAAVQLAKAQGAIVTAICSNSNHDLVRSLGADNVIDYHQQDFTQNGKLYDVIFDTVNSLNVSNAIKSLKPKGTLILSAAMMKQFFQSSWFGLLKGKKVLKGVIKHKASDIQYIQSLIEQGKYKDVIDRVYPLEEIVKAHAYVEKGHKKGNVVLEI